MDFERVEWYAGYRGEEKPRAVVVAGKRIEVSEIIWQKRIRNRQSGRTTEVFLCRLTDGQLVRIKRTPED